jgi:aspartyl-tRNA(Asn)/glutamyl-tRNA(Gln) amidotransferase subunit A
MPSAYCADVGIKPTYGLVPIRGIVPLSASRDHCGPLAKRVEDAAMMLNVMAGYDKLDIFSVDHPKEDYIAGMKQAVSGFRLGIPKGALDVGPPPAYTGPGMVAPPSAEVIAIVKTAIDLLGTLTAGPAKEVDLPPTTGTRSQGETMAYQEEYFKAKADLYQPTLRKSLEAQVMAHPSAEDYIRAQWAMQLLRRTIDDHFTDFDFVVMPTLKTEPPVLNDMIRRNLMNIVGLLPAPATAGGSAAGAASSDISSVGAYDVYGIPAISVPCGFTQDGLPVGLTIAGPHFSESKVFALAAAYEQATKWHRMKPPLTPGTPVPPLITHL